MPEEIEEVVENVPQNTALVAVGAGLGGLLVGAAVSHILTKRHLQTQYQQFADEEIRLMREEYFEAKEIVQVTKPELDDILVENGYKPAEGKITVEEATPEGIADAVNRNVFEEEEPSEAELGRPVWDYPTEYRKRSEASPYVLHHDEFVQNERDYMQSTLTYYAGDDVLTDERDTIIDDRDELVGLENLDRFGEGSEDPEIVYVRNPVREIDLEIVRSDGTYAKEVHGLDSEEELQHSARIPRRHAKFDDDEGR